MRTENSSPKILTKNSRRKNGRACPTASRVSHPLGLRWGGGGIGLVEDEVAWAGDLAGERLRRFLVWVAAGSGALSGS
jgi:hypothetical protein